MSIAQQTFSRFRLFFLVLSIGLTACHGKHQHTILGNKETNKAWVYLCGLTDTCNSHQEQENRTILQEIAEQEKIKIIAIQPQKRCTEFNNKLCWPHNTAAEVQETYRYILQQLPHASIAGLIGFSNGGFFLNRLAQIMDVQKPLISIGSAGVMHHSPAKNTLYLVIGKQDVYHYNHAIDYYNQSKQYDRLQVTLIEHEGGHAIPKTILKQLIRELHTNFVYLISDDEQQESYASIRAKNRAKKELIISLNQDVHCDHIQLNIPYIAQSDDYSCATTSLAMAISYFEKQPIDKDVAWKVSDSTISEVKELGNDMDGLKKIADYYGYHSEFKEGLSLNDLERFLSYGIPVVVNILQHEHGNATHAVLVTGYDRKKKQFFINDPALSVTGESLSYEKLNALWSAHLSHPRKMAYNSGFVIYPK